MEITLGKRIKQLVGEKKVRQQQIAAELGMNASTLSSYVPHLLTNTFICLSIYY